ncbi:transmembrane protein 69-like [Eucyclogobius newberryi]|uniref:transmembrane protein 69-like n=1 Tax=Eucyclogobius newberryi TaxID=166745 RepID=UPI003B5CF222
MFSLAFKRGAFISHKLVHSLGSSQRCWTSSRPPLSQHVTTSCFSSNRGPSPSPSSAPRLPPARSVHSSAPRLKKRPQPEPPPRELDLLRYDMKDLPKSPKPALYLGAAGLLPFACPTLFMAMTESFSPELAYAQVAYGASILSFLGGARWGFALPAGSPAAPDWMNLANSVVPSLLAWAAMLMSDTIVPAATMVIMGLGVALHYDLALLPTYPSWFKALRAVLTVVAASSLFGMILVSAVCPEKRLFSKDEEI